MAAVPTTTIRPRSRPGLSRMADPGAYLAAYRRAHRDEDDGRPVEVRDEEEEERGDAVDDGGKDVLDGVQALHGVVEQHAHQGEVDDALGGREVATVDAGEHDPGEQEWPAVESGGGAGAVAAALDRSADPGLQDDQHQREGHQDGDDRLERRGGQGEQEGRPGEAADQRAGCSVSVCGGAGR